MFEESFPPSGYTLRKNDDQVLFYKLEKNDMSIIPEVTDCIRIDSELIQNYMSDLFFKGVPVALPHWFYYGKDCHLSCKSMLKNFPAYLQSRKDLYCPVLENYANIGFLKKNLFSKYYMVRITWIYISSVI